MNLRFLHGLLVGGMWVQMEGLILDNKLIVAFCIHENIEPVRAGIHRIHGARVSAEPRKDLFRDRCVHIAETPTQAKMIVG